MEDRAVVNVAALLGEAISVVEGARGTQSDGSLMARKAKPPLPPLDWEQLIVMYPALRQSLLSGWDDCGLSTLFNLKYGNGWSTHPQARGTIWHAFCAEALRTMKRIGERELPVGEALEILEEVLLQRNVPPEDVVRVPLRQLPELRSAVVKWATAGPFRVDAIVDIEKRLSAVVQYPDQHGELRERELTGQLDVLLANAAVEGMGQGATVVDWKATWGLPPEPPDGGVAGEDDTSHVSYHGYFQQRFYGWLVMKNYPAVQWVMLREFYPYWNAVRRAVLPRTALPIVEREMAMLASTLDTALMAGQKSPLWTPSPGKHCTFCLKPGQCPIDEEARGVVTSPEQARRYAAERTKAHAIYSHRSEALKPWIEDNGPVPLKNAKGRRLLGWVANKTGKGRRFTDYTPLESDRGPRPQDIAPLSDAMKAATKRADEGKVGNDERKT